MDEVITTELDRMRDEIMLIRMGADYTGLTPKTHAWVSMDLLKRLAALLDRIKDQSHDG